jgi:hypothetical protein
MGQGQRRGTYVLGGTVETRPSHGPGEPAQTIGKGPGR